MLTRRSIFPMILFLSLLSYFVSMGCGDSNIFEDLADDNTKEAKLEEAQIALDDGDFTKAIDILLTQCGLSATDPASGAPTCDNNTIALLASAYMGRAGLDLIALIDSAVTASGQQGTFTEFSTLFLDPSLSEEDMRNAVELLAGIDNPTADQSLQMAVAAAADTILIIRDLTGLDANGLPNSIPSASDPATINAADQITQNVPLIMQGVTDSGIAGEDITQDITTIQSAISGTDQTVTSSELVAYLQTL